MLKVPTRKGEEKLRERAEGNDPMNDGDLVAAGRIAPEGQSSDCFAAPLGSLSSGYLLFVSGASNVTVHADPSMEDLYCARFEGQVPTVGVRGDTISIEYPRFPPSDQRDYWLERRAEVALNASIPWHIEVRGSTSRLTADLHDINLGSLKLVGGASRIKVQLPRPLGTVPVRILGGASNVTIHRPEGVAARAHVGGGATNLTFDEKHFGAIGGDVNVQSRDYDAVANRYDIEVTGGANNMTLDTQ